MQDEDDEVGLETDNQIEIHSAIAWYKVPFNIIFFTLCIFILYHAVYHGIFLFDNEKNGQRNFSYIYLLQDDNEANSGAVMGSDDVTVVEKDQDQKHTSKRTRWMGPSIVSPFTDPDHHVPVMRTKQRAKRMKKPKVISQPKSSEDIKITDMADPMDVEDVNTISFERWLSIAKESNLTTTVVVENIPRVNAKWFSDLWNPDSWLTDEVFYPQLYYISFIYIMDCNYLIQAFIMST